MQDFKICISQFNIIATMSKYNHILVLMVLIVSFCEVSESRKISLHLHHHEVFEVRPQHLVERDAFEYKEPSLHFHESKANTK